MSEASAPAPQRRSIWITQPDNLEEHSPYALAALERHKKEGLELALRARVVTLLIVAAFLPFLNPQWEVLYYQAILALLIGNGFLIRRMGRVGQSRPELVLIFLDLLVMTLGMVIPNPFSDDVQPVAFQYRFDNFLYFFLILASGTLAYSWRTVIAIGTWTAGMWTLGWVLARWMSEPIPGLTEAANEAFAAYPDVLEMMDPNSFMIHMRVQEVVVFVLVAVTLGISVRRFNRLLLNNATLERERANLSRYFSPNVVDELSQNDEPLKQVRNQNVAVLFIDIVGFTRFSKARDPREVIEALRGFQARMEAEVFRHNGTLDKYLGDGLMATFGTPTAGDRDASNALSCALAMARVMERWNTDRRRAGEPPIEVGIGVHYGEVVLGDIGANRLEFAVIGDAVNVASRLEALTREHEVCLIISDTLRNRVTDEGSAAQILLEPFYRCDDQHIRGVDEPLTVWCAGQRGKGLRPLL
ncbi:adenylate/guanylate cyclase domain-containing protein [Lutimaribacter marinistellae]|uniref:Adenylate/guanylate cyclase domain-containing protein n=1 Tax=Lutimaribacter marinistellae TaxID=1820329 RepID=A0ABV7TDT4_9RHOB